MPKRSMRVTPLLLLVASACGGAVVGPSDVPDSGSLTITPPSVTLVTEGATRFVAQVNAAVASVVWSVQESNGGVVDASGNYTAPAVTGTFHVVATSAMDSNVSAAASVRVTQPADITPPAALPRVAQVKGYTGGTTIDMGAARTGVLVAWASAPVYNYDTSVRDNQQGSVPNVYYVETAASTSGPWTTRVTVNSTPRTDPSRNVLHSRQHAFAAGGDRYLRLRITQGSTSLLRVDVFDTATAGTDDSFVIFGDSITMMSATMANATPISDRVAALTGNAHRPFVENAGIGFDMFNGAAPSSWDTDSRQRLSDYLPLFPGKYVGLAYGTNDAITNQGQIDGFKAAIRTDLDRIIAAGKVPIVATIPWGTNPGGSAEAAQKNALIAQVLAESAYAGKVLDGPDLYTFFYTHQSLIGDGTHPNAAGQDEWRRLWAETIVHTVYQQ